MRHRSAHDGVFGEPAARAVVAVKGEQPAVVVVAASAIETVTAGLHRLDRHAVAELEILDAVTERHDRPAELVTEDHRVLHAGERVRLGSGRHRPCVVLVQIAPADPVVVNAELYVSGARLRLRHVLEPEIAATVKYRGAHGLTRRTAPAWSCMLVGRRWRAATPGDARRSGPRFPMGRSSRLGPSDRRSRAHRTRPRRRTADGRSFPRAASFQAASSGTHR